jgi:MYXO-CTERM domain-containing protein
MPRLTLAAALAAGSLSLLLAPAAARAHFMLNSPQSWWTQSSDGSPQKMAPCGNEAVAGTAASTIVTKVQPGQTVAVQVTATIPHPGWYRISLKQGASSTQTAAAFPDPPTLGAAGTAQQCTPAFMDNPVWSPTQPVLADKLGLPAGSTSTTTNQSGSKTFNVTIPADATCTTASPCTLQVVMFMTDHSSGSCNYHHCADIAVETGTATGTGGTTGAGGGAGGASTTGSGGAAAQPDGGTGASTGTGSGDGGGGCAVAGPATPASAVVVALLALAAFRRRRRV